MPLYKIREFSPTIGQDCFIAPTGDVIGQTYLGDHVSIWFQTVIRGDIAKIIIGENTNVQDLSVLHVTQGIDLVIGKNVTIGHKATLHSCIIEDHCLIGMDVVVLDGAKIGKGSVVGAGSVVPPGKSYPENSLIMGSPAKVIRELTKEECETYHNHYKHYIETKNAYLKDLKLKSN